MADPTQPVFDRADLVRILGDRRDRKGNRFPGDETLLADVQALALELHAWETGGIEGSQRRVWTSYEAPCGQCAGTGWTGQTPCSWCNADVEVGSYRDFAPHDARRALNDLATRLRDWRDTYSDEVSQGVEVRPPKATRPTCVCGARLGQKFKHCAECGEQVRGAS